MRTISFRLMATVGPAALLACLFLTACESDRLPFTRKAESKKAPAPAAETDTGPVAEPDPTISPGTAGTPEKAVKPEKKLVYRVYPDEHRTDEYVELTELKFDCPEDIGRLFKDGVVRINPTLDDERKVPVERVKSLIFNKRGLVKPDIAGVGKLSEPVGYRDCTINLKNPDEELTGILVICRKLEGKKTDGDTWSANLVREAGADFHKIELIYK